MSNKLTTSLRTLRDGILDIEMELASRSRGLLLAVKFAVAGTIDHALVAAFSVGISLSDNAFMLLRQVTVTVLGERTDPLNDLLVNAADYDAGFADGRKGMVPARKRMTRAPK